MTLRININGSLCWVRFYVVGLIAEMAEKNMNEDADLLSLAKLKVSEMIKIIC